MAATPGLCTIPGAVCLLGLGAVFFPIPLTARRLGRMIGRGEDDSIKTELPYSRVSIERSNVRLWEYSRGELATEGRSEVFACFGQGLEWQTKDDRSIRTDKLWGS